MKTELLAPAGSFEAMTAACAAGADAVYIGGEKFGARAYADNLDREHMLKAIEYTRLHGKKLYLTVNTFLKERELEEELYDYLLPFYENGLDAVIVQDFGVFSLIRDCFPDLPIHCSTQMTITGPESAALLESMGASRIVTARELSLEEIRRIRSSTELEIESFVHGALCYCYSGQCLLSSMLGGRSGNRGKCAQPCRLPYQVFENGRKLNDRNSAYPLSPKDMCTIEILPEILAAGVDSLKIEGRMKRPEYAAGVVRIYRKYLDQCLEDKWKGVSAEDKKELFDLYNRDGFHQGYYLQRNGRNMMALKNEKASAAGKRPAHNEKLFDEIYEKYVTGKDRVPVKMIVCLRKNQPAVFQTEGCKKTVTLQGPEVQQAKNQPLSRERVEKQIRKTGATCFTVQELNLKMDEDIFIPMQELNEMRRRVLDMLTDEVNAGSRRKDGGYKKTKTESGEQNNGESFFFAASADRREQADMLMEFPEIKRIYASWQFFDENFFEKCRKYGKEPWLKLPYMVREPESDKLEELIAAAENLDVCGYLVHTPEQYAHLRAKGLEKKAVLNAGLSPWNKRGGELFRKLGMEGDTVPLELKESEILQRNNLFSELVVYGYVPLMVSAQCVKKNLDRCNHQNAVLFLQDRYQKKFRVQCSCDYCYNIIYNSVPVSLMKEMSRIRELPVRGFRFCFTSEDPDTVRTRTEEFLRAYQNNRVLEPSYESTKGHFRRGV
ncbi:MAG: peptidase U32 family protein [Ruminococcus sp.]|jgi:putative protease